MCQCDGMADVADSKSAGSDTVPVQVRPLAPAYVTKYLRVLRSAMRRVAARRESGGVLNVGKEDGLLNR